jgi:hypothetical protein
MDADGEDIDAAGGSAADMSNSMKEIVLETAKDSYLVSPSAAGKQKLEDGDDGSERKYDISLIVGGRSEDVSGRARDVDSRRSVARLAKHRAGPKEPPCSPASQTKPGPPDKAPMDDVSSAVALDEKDPAVAPSVDVSSDAMDTDSPHVPADGSSHNTTLRPKLPVKDEPEPTPTLNVDSSISDPTTSSNDSIHLDPPQPKTGPPQNRTDVQVLHRNIGTDGLQFAHDGIIVINGQLKIAVKMWKFLPLGGQSLVC